ncbi:RNase adapter RapZ [Tessaracoccus antarcticus]|uniref:RNase adapter RapZ n=1 Tax=Tessaracoccus antarcticus TaxID=2479848 RepID=A0A3M0G4D6_9ACTN|nr:RNase adapter RapZ [Tessaracoccus antarcticus]RMB59715.1 RNase adapter RapZ [Tessaracoccus antarcticus]
MPSTEPTQRLVIVTGMSGAGRRTAAHAMEDLGWYVVDNLPPVMLPGLSDELARTGTRRVAVGFDVRSREQFEQLPEALMKLRAAGVEVTVMFLEASDDIIVQRQESNRRPLPLQGDGRLVDGMVRERLLLADLRARADIVVNTSGLTPRQLTQRVANHFGDDRTDTLRVALMSFGFKNGLPIDADIVFDVRFLPNPFWVPALRPKTGLSPDVARYVLEQPAAPAFQKHALALLETMAPGYMREGKRQVTVAVGCTGGKHRSTAICEALAPQLRERGYGVTILHRDMGKE